MQSSMHTWPNEAQNPRNCSAKCCIRPLCAYTMCVAWCGYVRQFTGGYVRKFTYIQYSVSWRKWGLLNFRIKFDLKCTEKVATSAIRTVRGLMLAVSSVCWFSHVLSLSTRFALVLSCFLQISPICLCFLFLKAMTLAWQSWPSWQSLRLPRPRLDPRFGSTTLQWLRFTPTSHAASTASTFFPRKILQYIAMWSNLWKTAKGIVSIVSLCFFYFIYGRPSEKKVQ